MSDVVLSWHEIAQAAMVGCQRHIAAMARGKQDLFGCGTEDGWNVHILGAIGEMACAKALDRYWDGSVNTFRCGGDIGQLQVRTRSKPSYELIIRDGDRNEDTFILVRPGEKGFRVVGWIVGRDAKRTEWLHSHGNRPDAYFVPDEFLRPISELPE